MHGFTFETLTNDLHVSIATSLPDSRSTVRTAPTELDGRSVVVIVSDATRNGSTDLRPLMILNTLTLASDGLIRTLRPLQGPRVEHIIRCAICSV